MCLDPASLGVHRFCLQVGVCLYVALIFIHEWCDVAPHRVVHLSPGYDLGQVALGSTISIHIRVARLCVGSPTCRNGVRLNAPL